MLPKKLIISGHSMEPTIKDGDIVFVSNIFYIFNQPSINDIVAFKKGNEVLIKRIKSIINSKYFVEGDNEKDSFDSRIFGSIKKSDILGKVFYS